MQALSKLFKQCYRVPGLRLITVDDIGVADHLVTPETAKLQVHRLYLIVYDGSERAFNSECVTRVGCLIKRRGLEWSVGAQCILVAYGGSEREL